jgi:2-methylisocitrate lyase-like PEP mutase family enzyme
VGELAELGVRRVSVGGTFAFTAYGAVVRAAREILDQGTFSLAEFAAAGRDTVNAAFR